MKLEQIKAEKRILENIYGMDMSILDKLDLHVTINGGLSTEELIKTIDYHNFTEESFNYLIDIINKHRCTYNGVGPFLFRDGGWHNIREKKIDVIKKLTEENMRLKKDIEDLKEILESREEFIKDHCA
tara:strand:+ start:8441 stop:8824 length:384 start_codon:yes stop_codon:yes gene_type:complete